MNKENSTIGLFGAISIGIGGMVGGGILLYSARPFPLRMVPLPLHFFWQELLHY
jgi:hypothetical protein